MAADINHRVNGRRTAEALAARLVADAAVEARLRDRLQRPVVDLARDHQHQRAGRGDHPVVVPAAGFQQRHRCLGILGEPARDRAASGAAADHDKIECVRHNCPKLFKRGNAPALRVPLKAWAFADFLARARRFGPI